MKVSILTTTYNRSEDIERLYTSLVVNDNSGVDFEWLIMDDGSTDRTKLIVENLIKQNIIDIQYHHQPNQGKMAALNNLMAYATGDVAVVCDSDDYFTVDAMNLIKKYSSKLLDDDTVYALAFLKQSEKGRISGNRFPEDNHRSDMFSLYFREGITGEKILVFKTEIRKRYHHELEGDEKFVTEARMYHKMDLDFDIIGINKVLEIGDYKADGYIKNKKEIYKKYPLGFYEYFREILELDLRGVTLKQRMYIYKHYILFANLSKQSHPIGKVQGLLNKLIVSVLWIPGKIKTKREFGATKKVKKDKSEVKNKKNNKGKKEKKTKEKKEKKQKKKEE